MLPTCSHILAKRATIASPILALRLALCILQYHSIIILLQLRLVQQFNVHRRPRKLQDEIPPYRPLHRLSTVPPPRRCLGSRQRSLFFPPKLFCTLALQSQRCEQKHARDLSERRAGKKKAVITEQEEVSHSIASTSYIESRKK